MAFDNSTISQPDLHMNAASNRKIIGNHGSNGRIKSVSNWAAAELTAANGKAMFKILKTGYVGNFSLKASADMDTHATEALTWDVGISGVTATDVDEFMAAVTNTEAYAGHDTNEVAESTIAGTRVVKGDYINLTVKGAAATAVAGTMTLSFDFKEE